MVVSLVIAWGAMVMTVAIPWLVGRAVDAINEGTRADLLPLALAIVAAAILRLALTWVRRVVAGKVSLAVEFDLRQRVYGHLQSLELGFFDSQQTGQLMSRATVDLQSIRFFLGYGLIFLTQSFLTIALASVAMFVIEPWLAALALLPVPFVVVAARRYSRLSRPAVQEVQQRDRRAHRRGRGEHLGRADRQGVRPRGPHAEALSPLRLPRVRPERLLDPIACVLLADARLHPQPRPRRGPLSRRRSR